MIQTGGVVPADKGKLRKLIRKKVVELLKDKIPAVGSRVYPNASIPTWEEDLPVILIYQQNETATKYAQAPRELHRDFTLAIEIVAEGPEENDKLSTPKAGDTSLEDILDDIAEEVECLLDIDSSLGGTADDSIYKNTEFEYDSAGGVVIGSARITYGIDYYTMSPRSSQKQGVVDDFTKATIDYNVGADENTREAKDELDIPIT